MTEEKWTFKQFCDKNLIFLYRGRFYKYLRRHSGLIPDSLEGFQEAWRNFVEYLKTRRP